MSTRPSAAQVLDVLTEAMRLLGGPHDHLPAEMLARRAEQAAVAAIREAWPHLAMSEVARLVGVETTNAHARHHNARHSKWWRDAIIDELVGRLVADQYGERAS